MPKSSFVPTQKLAEYKLQVEILDTIQRTLEENYLSFHREQFNLNLSDIPQVPWEDFCKEMKHLKTYFSHLTYPEQKVALQKLIRVLNDTHTNFRFKSEQDYQMPIDFYTLPEGIFINRTSQEYIFLLGKKIVSVWWNPIEKAAKECEGLFPYRNESYKNFHLPSVLGDTTSLVGLGLLSSVEEWAIWYEDEGQIKEVILKNLLVSSYKQNASQFIAQGLGKKPENKEYYRYEYDEATKNFLFRYNKCTDMGDEKPFANFVEEMIAQIQKVQPQKFIVDLRYNEGGSSLLLRHLLSSFEQAGISFPQTVCLIGRQTFSSGIHAITQLFPTGLNRAEIDGKIDSLFLTGNERGHDEKVFENFAKEGKNYTSYGELLKGEWVSKNIIFIGEDTGGEPTHFWQTKKFQIEDNIDFYCSEKYFNHFYGNTFSPDIKIPVSAEDYFAEKDCALEMAKGL